MPPHKNFGRGVKRNITLYYTPDKTQWQATEQEKLEETLNSCCHDVKGSWDERQHEKGNIKTGHSRKTISVVSGISGVFKKEVLYAVFRWLDAPDGTLGPEKCPTALLFAFESWYGNSAVTISAVPFQEERP